MASVEERVGVLVEKHLNISDRAMLDADFSELGVTSMAGVKFFQTVNQEFGVDIPPEDASGFRSFRDLINHLGS